MRLRDKKIAIFIEDIYEDLEFWYPYYRMREEGAAVTVIGSGKQNYSGKNGVPARQDIGIGDAAAEDFDALIIPGGYSPDRMRRTPAMVEFVRKMDEQGKIVAAICHAGWLLASASVVNGRRVTSFFSIKDDMINAGADWVDKEVVQAENIITSRQPDDLPAFCRAIIESVGSV